MKLLLEEAELDYSETFPLRGSTRLVLAGITFFVFMHIYAVRVNISVAIVCMTSPVNPGVSDGANVSCLHLPLSDSVTLSQQHSNIDTKLPPCDHKATGQQLKFDWDRRIQGIILGSFFYGYLITQLAGGWLANKFGSKHVIGGGLLLAGVSTLFMPSLARIHYSLLLGQRVFVGMATGVSFPATNAMWGKWAPPLERTKLATLGFSGVPIGILMTNTIAGFLCESHFLGGWPAIFYVTGITSCLTWVVWMFMAYSLPATHPRISAKERHYIEGSIGYNPHEKQNIPWKAILTSKPVLALFTCHFCANWGLYSMLMGLPMYMSDVLKIKVSKVGIMAAVPILVGTLCALVIATIVDNLRRRRFWTTSAARKWMQAISTYLPAVCSIFVSFLDHTQVPLVMVLFAISSLFGSCRASSYNVNHVDIAPRFAGILYGISNTLGTVAGMISPIVLGILTPHGKREEWQLVFIISSVISCFGATVFIIFGSGEEQSWAKVDDVNDPEHDDIREWHTKFQPKRNKIHNA